MLRSDAQSRLTKKLQVYFRWNLGSPLQKERRKKEKSEGMALVVGKLPVACPLDPARSLEIPRACRASTPRSAAPGRRGQSGAWPLAGTEPPMR